jgi:hypothetical protein
MLFLCISCSKLEYTCLSCAFAAPNLNTLVFCVHLMLWTWIHVPFQCIWCSKLEYACLSCARETLGKLMCMRLGGCDDVCMVQTVLRSAGFKHIHKMICAWSKLGDISLY